ncbi:MAG TPA: hypothetical protein PKC91_14570 [Ignavibacteria bacterium]|nr:hypothetical protein [Ignavibacteria bacterium]
MYILLSIIVIILNTVSGISAQDSTLRVMITDRNNKKDSALSPFTEEQSSWFRNPEIPSFVIQGPDKLFSLGIGGFLNLTSSYDIDGIINDLDFITYKIQLPQNSYEKQQFQMYANASLLYFKVIQKISDKNLVGYLSANFRGVDNTFNLYQVYVKYLGLEFGKNWSTFSDEASWPITVNYLGLNSMTEVLNPLIRYKHKFAKVWEAGLSLEMPDFKTEFEYVINLKQKVPDIPAFLQYSFGSSHIRLAGIYRNLLYRDTINNENKSVTGAGVSLTGDVNFSRKVQMYFLAIYGEGIGNYIEDLSIDRLNVYPVTGEPGILAALPAYAYFGALQYNFNKDLFSTLMYSQLKVFPINYPDPDFYSYGIQFAGNMFWNFLPSAQAGLEYCFGKRVNQDGAFATANRFEFMLQYNF